LYLKSTWYSRVYGIDMLRILIIPVPGTTKLLMDVKKDQNRYYGYTVPYRMVSKLSLFLLRIRIGFSVHPGTAF
jgi:hypothetical protein